MKLKFVLGLFPVPVFFVDSLGEWKAGETRGPVVRIVKSHEDDVGLLEHELTHVRQWYVWCLGLAGVALLAMNQSCQYWPVAASLALCAHSILYAAVPAYRLWAEVQAYRAQASQCPEDRLELFAYFISTHYSLDATKEDALRMLRG